MARLNAWRGDASQILLLTGARLTVLRRAGRSRPWLTIASLLATAAVWVAAILLAAFAVESVTIARRAGAGAEVARWVHGVHAAVFLFLLSRPLFAASRSEGRRLVPDHLPVSDRAAGLVDWIEELTRPVVLGAALPVLGVAWVAADGPLRGIAAAVASLAMVGLAIVAGRRLALLRDELVRRAGSGLGSWSPTLTGLAVVAAVLLLATERIDPPALAELAERAWVLPSWWSATATLGRPPTALAVGAAFPLLASWLVPTTLAAEARLRRSSPRTATRTSRGAATELAPGGRFGALLCKDLRIAARDPVQRVVRAQWPAYLAASLAWAWSAGDASVAALEVQTGLLGLGMVLLRLPVLARPFDADGVGLVGLLDLPVPRSVVVRAKWLSSVVSTLPSVFVAVTCGTLLVAWREDTSAALAVLGSGLALALPALVLAAAVGTWASARSVTVAPLDGVLVPVLHSGVVVLGVGVALSPLVFVAYSDGAVSTGSLRAAAWACALVWSGLVSVLAVSAAGRELMRREEELSAGGVVTRN